MAANPRRDHALTPSAYPCSGLKTHLAPLEVQAGSGGLALALEAGWVDTSYPHNDAAARHTLGVCGGTKHCESVSLWEGWPSCSWPADLSHGAGVGGKQEAGGNAEDALQT